MDKCTIQDLTQEARSTPENPYLRVKNGVLIEAVFMNGKLGNVGFQGLAQVSFKKKE